MLWIAPHAERVIAVCGPHPGASDAANDAVTLPRLQAIGRALGG